MSQSSVQACPARRLSLALSVVSVVWVGVLLLGMPSPLAAQPSSSDFSSGQTTSSGDASELSGDIAGEVEVDAACIEELANEDADFAADYAVLATTLQDPEKIPVIVLYRTSCTKECTLGELWKGNERLCYTLELPGGGNERGKNCIPTGSYMCEPYSSKRFPNVYEITDVDGRRSILIHAGNTTADTHGCVLVGLTQDQSGGSVGSSRKALDVLRKLMGRCKFKLVVKEGPAPTPAPTPRPRKAVRSAPGS